MIHVHTTCDSRETATALARQALNARLAACVTLGDPVLSLFHWDGAIAEEPEIALTFKTTEAKRADLVVLIETAHPYDLPVITWESVGATPRAESWADDVTR